VVAIGLFTYGSRLVYPMYLALLPYAGLAMVRAAAPVLRRLGRA
jgi:hypothetical protein